MKNKRLLEQLGFTLKENAKGIVKKKYGKHDNYTIEIDIEKENFCFGDKIGIDHQAIQIFSQPENWVVLECVNRLLEKGYKPETITLEKTWQTGHGTSGRLDILVTHNGEAHLMIECKTWGTEFDKAFKMLKKNGGQLFTYFQQDNKAQILMLYTSDLEAETLKYRNEIIKIEEDYRQAGNVKDFYDRWNKLPKSNGVFESWAPVYDFQSKALVKQDLNELRQEDSSFIFNRFLEILRHNVVSDKPNAFNKIFTLFLCKIVDEYSKNEDEELDFQWLEGQDDHISFQKRLTDLYNKGMKELLEKQVTDVSDAEFNKRFKQVDEKYKKDFQKILTEIRLKKNNEFAIKEVYDDDSFQENAKVVKEVVELLQTYRLRYNYRQQFLSDFFELLLTTGLKQESGQFFTPVPIARFIIKSLPFQDLTSQKIAQGNRNDLLPFIIDYASGSGHFLTESMEEIQQYIDTLDETKYNLITQKTLKKWKNDQFDWADDYVYGIEKDYRLVKTAKVSCYLHGDGLAKVIHGDGLGDFSSAKEFKDLLTKNDKTFPQDNKQFDIVISNPPYSVSAFKGLMDEKKAKKGFGLYKRLTDQSSEIECLFIERTKQLLKDGGLAGIILPSSILSNSGIYTQAREILLMYFDILAIVEMGANTFMATGTNTVILFLRRRNNLDTWNIAESIKKLLTDFQDITINGLEEPLQKYISYVWKTIDFEDYKSLIQKEPNEKIKNHEIYKDYIQKRKAKNEKEKWNSILALEQEKLRYFILAYPQKLVLIKNRDKKTEKHFLGYEFSQRRGSEGIHPIRRGKKTDGTAITIDDCTQLYDLNTKSNPEKASTYIYKAFKGELNLTIADNLEDKINYQNLRDLMTFDSAYFEKTISLGVKKKVEIKSRWELVKLAEMFSFLPKSKRSASEGKEIGKYPFFTSRATQDKFIDIADFQEECLIIGDGGIPNIHISKQFSTGQHSYVIKSKNSAVLIKYIYELINNNIYLLAQGFEGISIKNISQDYIKDLKIPLPPIDIQEKIVSEIEIIEKEEEKIEKEIEEMKKEVDVLFSTLYMQTNDSIRLNDNDIFDITIGKRVLKNDLIKNGKFPVFSANVFEVFGYTNYLLISNFDVPSVLWGIDGDWMVTCVPKNKPFYPTDHCGILRIKNQKFNERYLAYALNKEGNKSEFSRNKRASIDRIQKIKIPFPSLTKQQEIVSKIEKIENNITDLEEKNTLIPQKKKLF